MRWRKRWYERYIGGSRLPATLQGFVNQYTEREFLSDFETLFPNVIKGAEPVDMLRASSLMYDAARGVHHV